MGQNLLTMGCEATTGENREGGYNLENCQGSTGDLLDGTGAGLLDNTDPLITAREVHTWKSIGQSPLEVVQRWVTERSYNTSQQSNAETHYGRRALELINATRADYELFAQLLGISSEDALGFLRDSGSVFKWRKYDDARAEQFRNARTTPIGQTTPPRSRNNRTQGGNGLLDDLRTPPARGLLDGYQCPKCNTEVTRLKQDGTPDKRYNCENAACNTPVKNMGFDGYHCPECGTEVTKMKQDGTPDKRFKCENAACNTPVKTMGF